MAKTTSQGVNTFEQCDSSWAGQFLELAIGQATLAQIENLFKNVTVIDFNYDRVLPEYLHSALQRRFDLPFDTATRCVAGLRILHPYGSIGALPWQDDSGTIEFGASNCDLNEIAKRIRTYTEESEGSEISTIKDVVDAARVFVVLGFGFHSQNMEILDAKQSGGVPARQVFATALGISDRNHQLIDDGMERSLKCIDRLRVRTDSLSVA
jgi:hypothetical protein